MVTLATLVILGTFCSVTLAAKAAMKVLRQPIPRQILENK